MKFGRNFVPAYNAQAVTTEGQIIVAAEITTEGVDFEQLEPMISAAERELEGAGVDRAPRGRRSPTPATGQTATSTRCASAGMIPIVAPDTTRNRPRKTRLGGPYDFMRQSARHRVRRRPLLTKTVDGRAGLRPDQGKPADRALQTKRPGGRTLGMAPDRRHSQPAEAPPAPMAAATA